LDDHTAPPPEDELHKEQAYLLQCRAERGDSVERLDRLILQLADETDEAMTQSRQILAERRMTLQSVDTHEFFGRISEKAGDRWYIGRVGIHDRSNNPLVVDWRAPVSAPFYQATAVEPMGLAARRRYVFESDALTGYFDEDLTDPTSDSRGGIADPILLEIGAARSGALKEIVATIQGEQDKVIRDQLRGVLVVQGGPGTGKTVVGLHRLAYLLYTYRHELAKKEVLVVGPSDVFLEYIGGVLPSLGEDSVKHRTVSSLIGVATPDDLAPPRPDDAQKTQADVFDVLSRLAESQISFAEEDIRLPIGTRYAKVPAGEINDLIERDLAVRRPYRDRRTRIRQIVRERLKSRGGDQASAKAMGDALNGLDRCLPSLTTARLMKLRESSERLGKAASGILDRDAYSALAYGRPRREWNLSDFVVEDACRMIVEGPKTVFAHVVVDEAQDLTGLELCILRERAPTGSLTVLGDLAQMTRPGGQTSWNSVTQVLGGVDARISVLSTGYRVPAEICTLANALLPLTDTDIEPTRSARSGTAPTMMQVASEESFQAVAEAASKYLQHYPTVGVLAPPDLLGDIQVELERAGLETVENLGDLSSTAVALLSFERCKGLEFDAVVAVEPSAYAHRNAVSARAAYVGLTRSVQELTVIYTSDPVGLAAHVNE